MVISGDEFLYQFSSSVGDDIEHTVEKKLTITRSNYKYSESQNIISNKKNYYGLTDDEKAEYQSRYDKFILPIRNFIDQYKESVN